MKNLKKVLLAALHLLILLLLASCGEKEPLEKKELVYASTKDIRDINPHMYSGEMAAQNMVFESLVINTEDGIKPNLAESWDISEDGLEYTFHLRKGVTFSDGAPFNAEAVKANMDLIVANKARHGWLDMVNEIKESIIVDEHTYKLVLKHPYYPALIELGLTRPFRFISPNCFKDGDTRNGVNGYIGTGPWILSEHKDNQYSIFKRNPNYWGQKPEIESVIWKVMPDHQTIILALQKGEIDLLFGADGDMIDLDSFNALKKQGKYDTKMSEPVASRALLLNCHQKYTKDIRVRRAFQYAIDKETIANGILNGTETIAQTLLSKTVPYCDVDLEIRNYDPEKSKQILDEAGWEVGKDGYRYKDGEILEVTLYFNSDNSQEKTISESVQNDLKNIGVSLKIVGEEKQAFLDRQRTGEFDLQYSLSWGTPYDPQSYVSSFRIPAHGDYQAQYGMDKKEWMDNEITALMIEPNENKRKEMYGEILTHIHEQAVYIPLTYSVTKAVYSSRVKGVSFNVSQYEIPFEKMYFEN